MAIEQRPIDANRISYHLSGFPKGDGFDSGCDWVFRDEIDKMPTVDAAPVVHGEWLDGYAVDGNGKKVYDSIDCSACEEVFKIESHDREYWKGRFKACPFCGAKMGHS